MNALAALVKLAVVLGAGLFYKHYDRHPLQPWEKIGSSAYVWVHNTSDSSQTVCAMAPEVDHAVRPVGVAAAHDSTLLRVPYADTRVTLFFGRGACPSSWERTP
jgi:hypothetical protein